MAKIPECLDVMHIINGKNIVESKLLKTYTLY